MPALLLIGLLAFFFVIIPIIIYNGLIHKRNMVDNAFASIDAMLKTLRPDPQPGQHGQDLYDP
jgi:hypothetical protein